MKNPHEQHIRVGRYLKDVIYGATDGIIASFAVVAAGIGGSFSASVLLVIGGAELFAEALSMASANYLGTRSEQDFYDKEEAEEWQEVRERPEDERREVRDILAAKGYSGRDLEEMTRLIISRPQFWIDFMMHEELGMQAPAIGHAPRSAIVTFVSFVIAGSIPLVPYVFLGAATPFMLVATGTGVALFILGALRVYFSKKSWLILGFEMLAIGGLAALIAYGISALIKLLV